MPRPGEKDNKAIPKSNFMEAAMKLSGGLFEVAVKVFPFNNPSTALFSMLALAAAAIVATFVIAVAVVPAIVEAGYKKYKSYKANKATPANVQRTQEEFAKENQLLEARNIEKNKEIESLKAQNSMPEAQKSHQPTQAKSVNVNKQSLPAGKDNKKVGTLKEQMVERDAKFALNKGREKMALLQKNTPVSQNVTATQNFSQGNNKQQSSKNNSMVH